MIEGEDELQVGGLTLRGVSRGGVCTCLMVPELDLMFDVGGIPRGALRHRVILVTHGHQDHLGALPYLVSQRSLVRAEPPVVHLPREIVGPMQTILDGWSAIEDFELPVRLVGHDPGDVVELRKDLRATCFRSVHRIPALAWLIERITHRLRPEYRQIAGEEIAELRAAGVEVTEPHAAPILCVTGDTQIELLLQQPRIRRCRVLVHEVTSWDDRRGVDQIRAWGHTHVDEMVEHAALFEGEALVLVHRSLRHSKQQAQRVVRERFPEQVRDRVHVFGK